jgi:hypothetical protein
MPGNPRLDAMELWKEAGGGTPGFEAGRWRSLIRERLLGEGSEFPDLEEVNWEILRQFYERPHPLLSTDIDASGLHYGIVELLYEAKAAHHLLDMAGVPRGYSMDTRDIDARTLLAVRGMMTLRERLSRISGWHSRETVPGGTTGDFCTECGIRWPCPTRLMADGLYAGEDS